MATKDIILSNDIIMSGERFLIEDPSIINDDETDEKILVSIFSVKIVSLMAQTISYTKKVYSLINSIKELWESLDKKYK